MKKLSCFWLCAATSWSIASAQAQPRKADDGALFTLTKGDAKAVAADPWRSSASSRDITGRAVYDVLASTRAPNGRYVVENDIFIRSIKAGSSASTPTTYHIQRKKGGGAFSPQFSPDGRFVLFKFGGIGTATTPFDMYVLDSQTHQVQVVKNPSTGEAYSPVFIDVRWSPDSQFLAWVEGVDEDGSRLKSDQPAQLRVCNWRTGQSRIVGSGDVVTRSFSWAAPHSLCYSVLPPEPQLKSAPPTSSSQREQAPGHIPTVDELPLIQARPLSYEVDAQAGVPHLLLRDAYRPVVSPSGRKVAFFGSLDPAKPYPLRYNWTSVSGSALALCTSARDGNERQARNIQASIYPDVIWQHDDRYLLTLEQTVGSPQARAEVRQYDTIKNQAKVITTLKATDVELVGRIVSQRQFQLLNVSPDDHRLYVLISQMVGSNPENTRYIERKSVISVNLLDGVTTTVAQTETSLGLDWHDDSPILTTLK